MARAMNKTTPTKLVEGEIIEKKNDNKKTKTIVEDTNKNEEVKKYEAEELIPCKSITNGLLLVDGEKSGNLYRWGDYGDVEYIEYRDLKYMVTARRGWLYKPRFIIQDNEFINQNPMLKDLYNKLYKSNDLKEILMLPEAQMVEEINVLPEGAYESIQGVAATMIMNGTLDSVRKIKVLDELFGTSLLLTLVQE